MSEAANPTHGVDATIKTLIAATRSGREEALQAWARGCDLYARYFAALGKAQGPEGIFAANAEFMTGGLEAFTKSASSLQNLNGAVPKTPKS